MAQMNGDIPLTEIKHSLVNLRESTEAATEQSKASSGQIRDNVASLGASVRDSMEKLGASIKESTDKLASAMDRSTDQAKESSKSAAKLAKSLNIITGCLAIIAGVQVLVSLFHH
jgi:methyl-accepting chemotaxis protein